MDNLRKASTAADPDLPVSGAPVTIQVSHLNGAACPNSDLQQ
jgi:hypothetical protein